MGDLGALLNPRTVAVIGASPDEHRLRGMMLKVMLTHPYEGEIYPVSRSYDEIMGLKAYPSIDAVPSPVDLAIMVIPSEFVIAELERCGKAGVRAVLIITSGFAEQDGDDGKAMQSELGAIAERYEMAVMGPNSEGFANTALSLAATFSPAMSVAGKPLLPHWNEGGRIAVVAQSGAVGFSFFDRGRERELPFRTVITTGNEACLEVFDFVEFLLDEGQTDVFILFLEDVKNPETFKRVADKALKAGKPLIVAKLGQSEASERATASHTGALAGDYRIYDAMFAHYGIVRGADNEQMVDIANAFLANLHRLPEGRRIGICTGSGGAGGWVADACVAEGLDVPELDPAARREIDAFLPAYGTSQNPVDGTAQAIRQIGYAELARLVSTAGNVDGVVMVTTARRGDSYERERKNFFHVARTCEKPIVCWTYTWPQQKSIELFAEAGFPLLTNMRNCARAMAALAEYKAHRDRYLEDAAFHDEAQIAGSAADKRLLDGPGRVLCEFEARKVLAACGIGSSCGDPVVTADEAVARAASIGGAVAMKIQSPDVLHKTEAGGVLLGLETADDVRNGFNQIVSAATAYNANAEIRGVLVEPMARRGVEMALGIIRDEKFGPMLMFGIGGVFVELLEDVVFAPVPLAPAQARSLVDQLKGAPLLGSFRGRPQSDRDALVDAIVRLSRFADDHKDRLAEIDLNPVIVHPAGEGLSVVDALIVKQS